MLEPVAFEYLPFGHAVQDAEPAPDLYFPAAQLVQRPPSEPVYPGSHLQLVGLKLGATTEWELAGHSTHGLATALQLKPSARYPVLQVQLSRTVLPTGESACTGQLMHV